VAVELIRAFKEIAFRLIDREHVAAFLFFCVLAIFGLLAYRMPADALAAIPHGITALLASSTAIVLFLAWALIMSLSANVVLFGVIKVGRGYYEREIARMGTQKRAYEERWDPERPRTFDVPVAQAPLLGRTLRVSPGDESDGIKAVAEAEAEALVAEQPLEKPKKRARKRD
jgi:hypothetical protein